MAGRITRRALLAAGVFVASGYPLVAAADAEWCWDDPPVLTRAPSGAPINVTVRIGVPAGYRDQLKAATTSATVASDAASVAITALVPSGGSGPFPVQVTATIAKDGAWETQTGVAGAPVTVALRLGA